jgi:hypothetical protein
VPTVKSPPGTRLTRVVKGWFVEGVADDDPEGQKPHRLSRIYHVREAAEEFMARLRQTARHPETINVRTRTGVDEAGDL